MKNLLLSALRSLKKSKISIIGLTLLVFFTSLTFTLMNDTSQNLSDTYRRVEQEGKLHDFYVKQNFTLPSSEVDVVKDESQTEFSAKGTNGKGFSLDTTGTAVYLLSCSGANLEDPEKCKLGSGDDIATSGFFKSINQLGDSIMDANGNLIALGFDGSPLSIHPEDFPEMLEIKEVDATHPAINLPNPVIGKYPLTFDNLPTTNNKWVNDLGLKETITGPILDTSGKVLYPNPTGNGYYLQLKDSFRIKVDVPGGFGEPISPLIDGKLGTWITINKKSEWKPVWDYIAKRFADNWMPYVENNASGELTFKYPLWLEADNGIAPDNLQKLNKMSYFAQSGGITTYKEQFFIKELYKPTDKSIETYLQTTNSVEVQKLVDKYTTTFNRGIESDDVKLTIAKAGVVSTSPGGAFAKSIPVETFATKIDWTPAKPIAYFKINNVEVEYEFTPPTLASLQASDPLFKFSIKEEVPAPFIGSVKTLILNKSKEIKQEQFINTYSKDADIKNFHSLNAESSTNQFYKFIETSPEDKVDTLIIDKGSSWLKDNSLPKPKDHDQLWTSFVKYMNDQFKKPANLLSYNNGKVEITPGVDNFKGVTITNIEDYGTKLKIDYISYISGNVVPGTYAYVDQTSYFSVISPEFADRNNKVPYTANEIIVDGKTYTIDNIQEIDPWSLSTWISRLDNKYKIDIDGAQYLIIGTGYSPDFMYPVMTNERITPDFENESLVYVNHAGMVRAQSTFSDGEEEEFFTGLLHDGVDLNTFMDSVEKTARAYTSLDEQYKMIRERNDTSEQMLLTPLRTVFAPNIVSTVNDIALWLTIFMSILTAFIAMVIIYRYIMSRRETLGILKANGINRWEVAFSLTPFALIAAFLGGISGYVAGILLQHPTIYLIHDYWSIPTPIVQFNWWTLLVSFIVPFVGITFFTILVVIWNLRHKSIDLMKPGLGVKTNFVARIMKKPFNKLSIITRFRVSIAFNSLGRLLTLSAIVASTVVALAFSIGVTGKFEKSLSLTQANKKYAEKINYDTPTNVGGEYIPQSFDEIGSSDPKKELYSHTPTNINTDATYCVNDVWVDDPTNINGNPYASPYEQCIGDKGLAEGATSFGNIQDINESTNKQVDLINVISAATTIGEEIWNSEAISKFVMEKKQQFLTPHSNITEFFDYQYTDKTKTIEEIVNLYKNQDKLQSTATKKLLAPSSTPVVTTNTIPYGKNIKIIGSDGYANYQYQQGGSNLKLAKFSIPVIDATQSSLLYDFQRDAKTYAIPHRMDSQNDNFFAYYSKNKVVVRELFDIWLGGAGVGQRPWNVLGKRLGSAQQAKSQQSYINFYKTIRKHLVKAFNVRGAMISNPDYDPMVDLLARTSFGKVPPSLIGDPEVDRGEWYNKLLDLNVPIDSTFTNDISSNVPQVYGMIRSSYIVLFRYISEKYKSEYTPYKVTMGNIIPFGLKDEKFTHIDGDVTKINNTITNDSVLQGIEITGIERYSDKMTLLNHDNNINEKLWENPNITPIIISAYASKYMDLKEGGKITFHNTNTTDLRDPSKLKYTEFTVVGIFDSYQGVNMYTTKEVANNIVGLSNTGFNGVFSTIAGERELLDVFPMYSKTGFYPSVSAIINPDGTISDNFLQRVLATMSLDTGDAKYNNFTPPATHNNTIGNWYELQITFTNKIFLTIPEGTGTLAEKLSAAAIKHFNDLLTPSSTFIPITKGLISPITAELNSIIDTVTGASAGTTSMQKVQTALRSSSAVWKEPNAKATLTNIKDYIKRVAMVYGSNIQTPMIKGVESKTFTSTSFNNLSKVMTTSSAAILGAIAVIAILILIVIAHITIAENEKVIATFKVLGFKNKTTIANLLSIYIPVILIGLAIAVPVSIGMLALFNALVFSNAGILLSLQAQWWYYVVAVGAVALIMSISLAMSWNSIKKIGAVAALK